MMDAVGSERGTPGASGLGSDQPVTAFARYSANRDSYMWGILNVNTSSHVPQDETYVGLHPVAHLFWRRFLRQSRFSMRLNSCPSGSCGAAGQRGR